MQTAAAMAAVKDRASTMIGSWRDRPELRVSSDPGDVEAVTVRYLMYVLLPVWFVPGVADYVMHRRTRIERTSGLPESGIHALMMAEIAVPLTLTLFCEVNPLLLSLVAVAAGVHEATAIWDVRAATDGGRDVRPAEQHIHSFLESLPVMALAALACLHWDQVARSPRGSRAPGGGEPGTPGSGGRVAPGGDGRGTPGGGGRDTPGGGGAGRGTRWRLRLRRHRLPRGYLAAIGAGVLAFIAVPYGEELWRCARARRRG